jgi:endonuclease/exonuclease/phosphatase family metal-dependent hydrolase
MLTIMTLNVNSYGAKHGPWAARRKLICEAIEQAGADVIALQAVGKDPAVYDGLDQAAQLAELLQVYRYHAFQPAMQYDDGREEGLAFLSRFANLGTGHRKLSLRSGLEDTNQRIVLAARIAAPAGQLQLVNAHFSWVEEQTLDNVQETLAYLSTFNEPVLLVGDLNASPDSRPMRTLAEAGWHDAWAELHPTEPGHTFESNNLTKRIDYAWLNGQLWPKLKTAHIVAGNQDVQGARPSDHLGLTVMVE